MSVKTAIEELKNSVRDTNSYGPIVFWGNPNFLIVSKYEFDEAIAELEKQEKYVAELELGINVIDNSLETVLTRVRKLNKAVLGKGDKDKL